MKNKIEFRGIRTDGKGWVYGDLSTYQNLCWICNCQIDKNGLSIFWDKCEVIQETVGQFAGLKDKNGVKIFDGDLIEYGDSYTKRKKGIVKWELRRAGFVVNVGRRTVGGYNSFKMAGATNKIIIGTIHDHLLKEEGENDKTI